MHDTELANYYNVLNVDPASSRVEIREAYLRLKSTYGPGSAALYSLISEDEAKGQLARVEEAFRVLGDEVSRREYDRRYFGGSLGARAGATVAAHAQDSEAMARGEAQQSMHADRLLHVRDREDVWAEGNTPVASTTQPVEPERDPTVVRTTRSTLPIIQLKVNRGADAEVKEAYAEMVATSDPGDGDLYKRLRDKAGVTEDEMQDRIKVSIGYLRAIETNRFDRLPQAVYVKGFLRSYFRYLDVPEAEKLITAFGTRLSDWQANKKS